MFGFGTHELILIAVIVVVIFGATKIPALGSSIGEGIRNFKRGMREVREEEPEAERRVQALSSDTDDVKPSVGAAEGQPANSDTGNVSEGKDEA